MRRKGVLIVLLIIFSLNVSGLEVSIKDSCSVEEEPLVSFYNDTDFGGHLGAPGYFSNQVCVEGERDFNIRQQCGPEEIRVFSMFSENNSHFSMYSSYTYEVCSKNTRGAVRNSCFSNETAAFTVLSDNNSHVRGPDYQPYSQNLCLFKQPPKNITMIVSGLKGSFHADDDTISQGETIRIAEFPYIVAEDSGYTRGIISNSGFVKLERSSEKVSVTQTGPTFLVPFTEGDHENLEDRQEMVISGRFFNILDPSFGFNIPESPRVKVAMKPDRKVKGFSDTLISDVEVAVQNQGLQDGTLVISIEPL